MIQILEVGSRIGFGLTSEVFIDQQNQRAVKIFKSQVCLQRRQNEIQIICMLNHQHIICLVEYDRDDFQWFSSVLYQKIINYNMSYDIKIYILCKMAGSLKYIHDMKIVHRDIKLQNVLYKEKTWEPILCDFGFGVDVTLNPISKRYEGTQQYMAPELLNIDNDTVDSQELFACDIYSLGVLGFQLIMGYFPYNFPDLSKYKYNYPKKIQDFWDRQRIQPPVQFRYFIQGTLAKYPIERINIKEVLNCELFSNTLDSCSYQQFMKNQM